MKNVSMCRDVFIALTFSVSTIGTLVRIRALAKFVKKDSAGAK